MCGFLVTYRHNENTFNKAIDKLKHRGPDNTGIISSNNILFGHTRLSIRDLESRSNQPFIKNGNILVYNGEIYNTKYLSKEFLNGVNLSTNSDTEILSCLLEKYGSKILNKIDGMFSFVYFNNVNSSLLVARDPIGIKPLYFMNDNGSLILSSEIKPIKSFKKLTPCRRSLIIGVSFLLHVEEAYTNYLVWALF